MEKIVSNSFYIELICLITALSPSQIEMCTSKNVKLCLNSNLSSCWLNDFESVNKVRRGNYYFMIFLKNFVYVAIKLVKCCLLPKIFQ